MPINAKQNSLYWRIWGRVRKHVMAQFDWTAKQADAFRHTLHVRALGYDKSHTAFTNGEFDQIKDTFLAIVEPHKDHQAARQQPTARAAHTLQALVDELGLTADYVDGIARRVCKKRVIECTAYDFPKLIAALKIHQRRLKKKRQVATSNEPF